MISPLTEEKIKQYWSSRYNVPVNDIVNGTNVLKRIDTKEVIEIVSIGKVTFISHPANDISRWNSFLISPYKSVDDIKPKIKENEEILGPGILMYADKINEAKNIDSVYTIQILPKTDLSWNVFREELGEETWESFGLELDDITIEEPYVVLYKEKIIASSYIQLWDNTIAHIGIATLPQYRGLGLGRKLVQKISNRALELGFIPQYRTLATNYSSIKLAEALGFKPLGESIAILPKYKSEPTPV